MTLAAGEPAFAGPGAAAGALDHAGTSHATTHKAAKAVHSRKTAKRREALHFGHYLAGTPEALRLATDAPPTPGAVKAVAVHNTIAASWPVVPGANHYVAMTSPAGGQCTTVANSCTMLGVPNNTYTVYVVAYGTAGTDSPSAISPASMPVTAAAETIPVAPPAIAPAQTPGPTATTPVPAPTPTSLPATPTPGLGGVNSVPTTPATAPAVVIPTTAPALVMPPTPPTFPGPAPAPTMVIPVPAPVPTMVIPAPTMVIPAPTMLVPVPAPTVGTPGIPVFPGMGTTPAAPTFAVPVPAPAPPTAIPTFPTAIPTAPTEVPIFPTAPTVPAPGFAPVPSFAPVPTLAPAFPGLGTMVPVAPAPGTFTIPTVAPTAEATPTLPPLTLPAPTAGATPTTVPMPSPIPPLAPGTGAPSAPLNLTAIPYTANGARVSWTAPASAGAGISHYTVMSQPGGLTCDTPDANTTACTVMGLSNGLTYFFFAEADSIAGNSAVSEPSGPVAISAIDAPAAVMVTPGDGQLAVSWSTPTTGNAGITGYTATAGPGVSSCSTADPAQTSCVITGLLNGGNYSVTVVAHKSGGVADSAPSPALYGSPASATAATPAPTATPAPIAGAIQAPTSVAAAGGLGVIGVAWNPSASSGVSHYTATASPGGRTCSTADSSVTECLITGLTAGTPYTITVVTVGSDGSASAPSGPYGPVTPTTQK
jgi:hypothetical protein